ncbi:general negative regulator of transcription subunit 5 [Vermiconidia calcicola]|uniref:General negative regulator of transcription subunit 5 n=1 Tax=Vermiconidia calcicola TaxID=1690605 RepID=A0ACC3MCH5_9PEZI|nr:general negative regulator of transcription subunit 5 [Vermiconidia calcicola]
MAQRKLQQGKDDREFKKVDEGVALFEQIHEKLMNSQNTSQKDKLEDALKKEIKKLQRSRDKIKGWASMSEIKDKKPLMDKRKLIETCMETFKAVEKEMKTKTYSKEGLSAAAKVDPKEKEKMEVCDFVAEMVDSLGMQVETLEAEAEVLQAGLKKKKGDTGRADRLSELERTVERHKWHSGKLEIVLRALENGSVETEQVKQIEDGIKYYVEQNQELEFMEDDSLYDDLNLEEEEDIYGLNGDNDRGSSQDAQSVQDEPSETEPSRSGSLGAVKSKSQPTSDSAPPRRASVQLKSPLPALSTLHSSLPNNANGKPAESMKPAPLPTIPTGQPLKYASAAAAAAASDKNGVGIAPLPPPPGMAKTSASSSPSVTTAQPANAVSSPPPTAAPHPAKAVEQPRQATPAAKEETRAPEPVEPAPSSEAPSVRQSPQPTQAQSTLQPPEASSSKVPQPPSPDSGIAGIALSNGEPAQEDEEDEEESIYHLPSSLTDLLDSFEETKKRATSDQPFDMGMLGSSRLTAPTPLDAERPNHYQPQNRYPYTPAHYPQEPLGIFDDPRLYSRIDTDSLFYAFYYRQGTYQQYLAAKALKSQSWRFHKQYQTWFQRHEEPKNITEEFEQGTYRFFDYESTWMNRRKADFKFAYKFLEDDL